jgi:hypothetical protein
LRWKIEHFHRELKQVTGVEKCQCRKARIKRDHIACTVLVWVRLTAIARKSGNTTTRLKNLVIGLPAQGTAQSVCFYGFCVIPNFFSAVPPQWRGAFSEFVPVVKLGLPSLILRF